MSDERAGAADPPDDADRAAAAGSTGGTGKARKDDKSPGYNLARQALEQAKADARERGALPGRDRRGGSGARGGGQKRRGRGDRGDRGGEPARFGAVLKSMFAENGWEQRLAIGAVFGRWAQIVGPGLAEHTRPVEYADGELIVVADSPVWATQLRLLASDLVRRLNEELGDGSVRRVKVRGPEGPRRRPGMWRVR